LDSLVEGRVRPLLADRDEADDPDALRRVVARVEVCATQVHIFIRQQVLASLIHRRVGLEWIRARTNVSDRVLIDPLRPTHIRLEAAVRLKVRGGRAFSLGPDGEPATENRADRKAIRRLRTAHRALSSAGIHPTGDIYDLRRAKAPVGASPPAWAFLAPEIQRAILVGALSPPEIRVLTDSRSFPLCWADQMELIGQV
jgi:hypothetical protein